MSRHRKALIIISVLIITALLILLDHHHYNKRIHKSKPDSQEQLVSYDFEKYHDKTFTVVKVVDGDTIDIDIPDNSHNHTRIRLWGIDTPETKNNKTGQMYFGHEASEYTNRLVYGKKVTVYLENRRTRGKYGRLLGYVQLSDEKFLNEVLVEEGYAYADLRFAHQFYNKYKQLQASAKNQNKGLWRNVTRDKLPQWLQRKEPKLLK